MYLLGEMSVLLTLSEVQKLAGEDFTLIKKLDASKKNIRDVVELSPCVKLVRLDLSHNVITKVGGFVHCTLLTWLDVSHNQLDSLVGLHYLVNLSVLRASHNNLTTCGDICNLSNLKALILSHNQLSYLPDLSSLSQLNTLVLSHNQFESVCVENLRQLSKLSLSHNCLKAVPDTQKNQQLRELRLNENKIRSLPESLKSNKKLKILDLGNNKLKDISVLEPLRSLGQLGNVNLKGNRLCERATYPHEVLKLQPSVTIMDGARVEQLQSSKESSRVTQKNGQQLKNAELVKSPLTVRSGRRHKRKRETEVSTEEDSPAKKGKRAHSPELEGRETAGSFAKSVEISKGTELATKSELAVQASGETSVEEENVGNRISLEVGGEGCPTSRQELKASLKSMSKGRSGVVAMKEVRKRGKRKKRRGWDPIEIEHQVGTGQLSTWT